MDLSIVIVSWNVRGLLRACLGSVERAREYLDLEVIVVDGGSVDGSVGMVREGFDWVVVVARPDNVGFPKGNNIGIAQASGRYVLLLNPDTEVVGDALAKMVAYMDANPEVGALGGQLLYPDGVVQSSRRRFPTLATGYFESTWLEPFAPRGLLERYYVQDRPDDVISEVDWVVGACLLVRREAIEQVGVMDAAYFMYSEELDWCRRIKGAGWRVVYFPEAQIIHHEGKSSEQVVTSRHIYFQRAKLRYFRKYHGRLACWFLRVFLLKGYVWQICVEGAKGLVGHKRALRWERVGSYWRVVRSGLRPAGY